MKISLVISILLNVLLAAMLVVFWRERLQTVVSTPPVHHSDPGGDQPNSKVRMAVASTNVVSPSVSFQWSQLYSKDYHLYVKNLRAIACPEPTLRAIVTSDVDSAYQVIASQMREKLASLATNSWSVQVASAAEQNSLKTSLQNLPEDETVKIADFLGLNPAPTAVANTPTAKSSTANSLSMPLVMQNIDLSSLNLDSSQSQVIANIKAEFWQQVGNESHDPNDPAYQVRWKSAQANANNMLQAWLGNDVYTKFQLASYQAMIASIPSSQN